MWARRGGGCCATSPETASSPTSPPLTGSSVMDLVATELRTAADEEGHRGPPGPIQRAATSRTTSTELPTPASAGSLRGHEHRAESRDDRLRRPLRTGQLLARGDRLAPSGRRPPRRSRGVVVPTGRRHRPVVPGRA